MDTTEMKSAIETAMDLILDGKPDSALAVMWVVHRGVRDTIAIDNDQPRMFADEVRKELPAPIRLPRDEGERWAHEERMEKDRERKRLARERARAAANGTLPKMQPLQAKRIRAIDVGCKTCGAKPGNPCFAMSAAGGHGVPMPPETIKTFHLWRRQQALHRTQKAQDLFNGLPVEANDQPTTTEGEA